MLQPKRSEAYRKIWLQIKQNGYDVIPLRMGKEAPFKGWPTTPNAPDDIAKWSGRGAAIRMYGSGLFVIDIDVRIAEIADAITQMIAQNWPTFAAACLWRHSGGTKVALIGRADTNLRYLNTRRHIDPNDPEKGHRVEVFTTHSKRYVGVHGLHSIEGGAERHYGYHGRSILEAAAAGLPSFPAADIGTMVEACEGIMREHGLEPVQPVKTETQNGVAYDIGDDTRFDVLDGPDQISYDELCALHMARGDLRVSSSFLDGGHNRTRCRVGDCYAARCVGVFVHGEETWHCPKDADPAAREAAFGPELAQAAAEQGFELPPDIPNWRERYEGGRPKASLHNAKLAIGGGGFVCSYDVFHNKMFIGRAGPPLPPFCGEVTDHGVLGLREWLSDHYGLDFTDKHVRDAVTALALGRRFNPVTDMLAEAEANWDRVPRLDRMAHDYLGCADTTLNAQCVRKTMIAAVARARVPGCKFDTMLVLESPEGWNKSSAWSVLAGEGNFSDERIIGKDSREVVEQLSGIWIHENADLAGMRKAEVETVKAYASRVEDRARPAYGHFLIAQPRHSIEVGTTNNREYLQSQTGNRRFWPMLLERVIDLRKLKAARLQLWGEAAAAQSAGESLVLNEALWADAAIEQEARRVRDPWEARLEGLAPVSTSGPLAGAYVGDGIVHIVGEEHRVATTVIFQHVLEVKNWQLHAGHAKRLADVMRVLGWSAGLFKIDGKPMRGYIRKTR